MKLQILPNWCKKLGLVVFLVFSFLGVGDDFIDGFNSGYNVASSRNHILPINENVFTFSSYFGENLTHFFEILGIIGILIYMISKEKIEDDYIDKLRLESYQLSAIIGLILSILLYSFSKDLKLTLDYFIMIYLIFYFTIFSIKKRMD
ncbi:hypothetical protein [Lutibacter sp. B1]|uniref:hypothetical protein n=1 Tax=Lutibacter sp. B1 TaxID=2725996 RepID=UPI001456351A|nr:hypothetical protein [Lutibacter sp. B1]NLP57277.1 hypothetical protein [Lutibacter sp. B1]